MNRRIVLTDEQCHRVAELLAPYAARATRPRRAARPLRALPQGAARPLRALPEGRTAARRREALARLQRAAGDGG